MNNMIYILLTIKFIIFTIKRGFVSNQLKKKKKFDKFVGFFKISEKDNNNILEYLNINNDLKKKKKFTVYIKIDL